MDLPHPLAVPSSQVVVHCAQVHSTTSESVQIGGKCGHQGLPLAGTHLGDPSQVEGDPAHHLDVVMALAENPLCGLSDHRERLDKKVVEFLTVFYSLAELSGTPLQLLVGESCELRFQGVDVGNQGLKGLDLLSLTAAQHAR